jgi:large subunit ribosomal protein L9
MEVILLERVAKLGQIGDVVRVRDGFARNFLLPQGKALRATDANRAKFETMKSELEARNLELKSEAERVHKSLDGHSFILIRQAGETGQLYGSVSGRDIAAALGTGGFVVDRRQVVLNTPIKSIGLHKVPVALHAEVEVVVIVNVARSDDEAARQARGEDLTVRRTDEEEARAEARVAADKFFEAPPAQAGEPKADAPAEAKPEKPAKAKKRKEKAASAAATEAAPAEAKEAKREKKPRKEKKDKGTDA